MDNNTSNYIDKLKKKKTSFERPFNIIFFSHLLLHFSVHLFLCSAGVLDGLVLHTIGLLLANDCAQFLFVV